MCYFLDLPDWAQLAIVNCPVTFLGKGGLAYIIMAFGFRKLGYQLNNH
jgi:uncharacterized membrane protein YhdT